VMLEQFRIREKRFAGFTLTPHGRDLPFVNSVKTKYV
jgi:hypothetical protein